MMREILSLLANIILKGDGVAAIDVCTARMTTKMLKIISLNPV